jgi:hypothetical protein
MINIGLTMILHIFECKKCQRQQKHVTSSPNPMGLIYELECATCNKMRTFQFVREENRKEGWPAAIELETMREPTTLLS